MAEAESNPYPDLTPKTEENDPSESNQGIFNDLDQDKLDLLQQVAESSWQDDLRDILISAEHNTSDTLAEDPEDSSEQGQPDDGYRSDDMDDMPEPAGFDSQRETADLVDSILAQSEQDEESGQLSEFETDATEQDVFNVFSPEGTDDNSDFDIALQEASGNAPAMQDSEDDQDLERVIVAMEDQWQEFVQIWPAEQEQPVIVNRMQELWELLKEAARGGYITALQISELISDFSSVQDTQTAEMVYDQFSYLLQETDDLAEFPAKAVSPGALGNFNAESDLDADTLNILVGDAVITDQDTLLEQLPDGATMQQTPVVQDAGTDSLLSDLQHTLQIPIQDSFASQDGTMLDEYSTEAEYLPDTGTLDQDEGAPVHGELFSANSGSTADISSHGFGHTEIAAIDIDAVKEIESESLETDMHAEPVGSNVTSIEQISNEERRILKGLLSENDQQDTATDGEAAQSMDAATMDPLAIGENDKEVWDILNAAQTAVTEQQDSWDGVGISSAPEGSTPAVSGWRRSNARTASKRLEEPRRRKDNRYSEHRVLESKTQGGHTVLIGAVVAILLLVGAYALFSPSRGNKETNRMATLDTATSSYSLPVPDTSDTLKPSSEISSILNELRDSSGALISSPAPTDIEDFATTDDTEDTSGAVIIDEGSDGVPVAQMPQQDNTDKSFVTQSAASTTHSQTAKEVVQQESGAAEQPDSTETDAFRRQTRQALLELTARVERLEQTVLELRKAGVNLRDNTGVARTTGEIEAVTIAELAKLFDTPMQQLLKNEKRLNRLSKALDTVERAVESGKHLPAKAKKQRRRRQAEVKASQKQEYVWSLNLISIYSDVESAQEAARVIEKTGIPTEVTEVKLKGKLWYRIRIPGFESLDAAMKFRPIVTKKLGRTKYWIGRSKVESKK